MRLQVLFFGILKDTFGPAESLTVPDESTAADILAHYADRAPHLASLWPSLAVAVNQHYATASTPLADGDEVALLPPVSGGAHLQ